MFLKPDLAVSVDLLSDHNSNIIYPRSFTWNGKNIPVKLVNLHQIFKSGQTLYHTFCVQSEDDSLFRLVLDTDTLGWTLDEISNTQEG